MVAEAAHEMRRYDDRDPSDNVLRLVEDMSKRMDSEIKRIDDKQASNFNYLKQSYDEGFKRIEDILNLNFTQFKESATRETKRVDDNREADNRAVLTAANKTEIAAGLMQNNVVVLAETLRKSMETNAQALALQLTVMDAKSSDRITIIEKTMAENRGESKSSEDLPKVVKALELLLAESKGASTGSQITKGTMFASISAAGVIIGIIISLTVFFK